MFKKINSDYLRNLLFGAEDSLVSTVGVLFGLASASEYNAHLLILSGFILIAVEALSMGVGSYLSETEVHELDLTHSHKDSTLLDGILMLGAYLFFGIIVLTPYFLFPLGLAKYYSVAITLFFLFVIGYIPADNVKDGIRMLITAGAAISVGFFVAKIF